MPPSVSLPPPRAPPTPPPHQHVAGSAHSGQLQQQVLLQQGGRLQLPQLSVGAVLRRAVVQAGRAVGRSGCIGTALCALPGPAHWLAHNQLPPAACHPDLTRRIKWNRPLWIPSSQSQPSCSLAGPTSTQASSAAMRTTCAHRLAEVAVRTRMASSCHHRTSRHPGKHLPAPATAASPADQHRAPRGPGRTRWHSAWRGTLPRPWRAAAPVTAPWSRNECRSQQRRRALRGRVDRRGAGNCEASAQAAGVGVRGRQREALRGAGCRGTSWHVRRVMAGPMMLSRTKRAWAG